MGLLLLLNVYPHKNSNLIYLQKDPAERKKAFVSRLMENPKLKNFQVNCCLYCLKVPNSLLECGHRYCQSCIDELKEEQKVEQKVEQQLFCPSCGSNKKIIGRPVAKYKSNIVF